MLRVGLTGGIGAGKSTVAAVLARLGARIVDADVIAREVVEPGTSGLAALVEEFGEAILTEDGALDRPALALVAFADEESRLRLNAVLHPRIGRRTQEYIEEAPDDAIVVQDIPLLVEGGMAPAFHLVIVVDAEVETRIERLVGSRGLDESDARARISAQATTEQRRAAADVWLDNSGAPGALDDDVERLWHQRLVPFGRNLLAGRAAQPNEDAAVGLNPDGAQGAADRLAARIRMVLGTDAHEVTAHATDTGVEAKVSSADVRPDTLSDRLRGAGLVETAGSEFRGADPANAMRVIIESR